MVYELGISLAGLLVQLLSFEEDFEEHTMSVHMKEGVLPVAKRGTPGDFRLETLADRPTTRTELMSIVRVISELCRNHEIGTVELSLNGATVYQYGNYRVAVTRPAVFRWRGNDYCEANREATNSGLSAV